MAEPLALFEMASPDPDPVVAQLPVGPIIDTSNGPEGLATATFDSTRRFRFRLSRVWDASAPRCVFAMLNPSTADALVLDPTVRRCVGFAKRWGFGALEVTNVFALRSTDPKALYTEPDPVGVGNDEALVAAAKAADLVVAAWGVHAVLHAREEHVRHLFVESGIQLSYLRLTKDGHPGHPLYVPGDVQPTSWT